MRWAILACLALVPALEAQEPGSAPAAVPVIVTSGEATVRRVPDVAFITFAVESRARSSREAQRLNADATSMVQRRIADERIGRDALRTLGLSLEQEFDNANGRRIARGFVARNMVEIRIEDVARVGEIADAVVDAGATSLGAIRFDLRDRTAAEREALRLAVADARGRADAAAAGAGRAVDRVLKIDDSRAEAFPPRPISFARAEVAPGNVVTDVAPGLIEIRGRVTLTVTMR